jgi:hypothetical protein
LKGADTLKISGVLKAASVKVNASKNYLIRRTADTDELTGGGSLIKDGTGSLIMDFKNSLTGGAGVLLDMPLDKSKNLQKIVLETRANEIIIGLMALTLRR